MTMQKHDTGGKKKHSRAGILFALILFLIAAGGAVFFYTDCRLENIEFKNDSIYSDEELKEALFTAPTDKYACLFYARLRWLDSFTMPFIEKTSIELTDRNSVVIYVYGKPVIGCVEHMGKYMHFDRNGVVLESADTILDGIPEIKGLKFNKVVMNEQLELSDRNCYDTMLEILQLLEKNGLTADDITFNERFEVILHMNGHDVLLGLSEHYDVKLNNLGSMMRAVGEGKYVFDLRNYSEDNAEATARPK